MSTTFAREVWLPKSIQFFGRDPQAQTQSPIAHLLFLALLFLPARDALEMAKGSLWRCPNRQAPCHGKFTLSPPAVFKDRYEDRCRACGLEFRFVRPSAIGTIPEVTTYLQPGPILKAEIVKSYQNHSLVKNLDRHRLRSKPAMVQIAKNLGIPAVFVEHVLIDAQEAAPRTDKHIPFPVLAQVRIKKAKENILRWLREHPKASLSQFNEECAKDGALLRKVDKAWFQSVVPPINRAHLAKARRAKARRRFGTPPA